MSQGNRKVQYLVTFAVCLAAVTTGVSLTWTTPVLPKLKNNETDLRLSSDEQIAYMMNEISWLAAIGSPGFMVGSLAARFVSDRLGRKSTILGSAFPILAASILVVCCANIWLLYLARVLWGIGIGMIATVSTIYLAEISDKDIRGALSVSSRFMFNLGNFLVMAIGPLVSFTTLNFMLLPLPVIYFIACWFIPETPYYSLKAGKVDQARSALKKLRTFADDKELETELAQMGQDVKKETQRSGSLKELLTGRQYRKALIICTGLKTCQMLTGSVVIQHYFAIIIVDSKAHINLSTACIIFGAVRFITAVMSSMLADRLGRRPLLIYSFIGTALSLALTGGYFYFMEIEQIEDAVIAPYGIIAFIGIILSVVLSTLGYSSLIYLIPAELFPLNVKSIAMTSLNIFGGLSNFGIIKGYQVAKDNIGLFGVFTIFAAVSLGGCIFSYILIPETKGKSLREILVLLQGTQYDEAAENLNKITTIAEINGTGEETEMQVQRKEC